MVRNVDDFETLRRRTVLSLLGTTATAALAGCSGDDTDDDGSDDGGGDADGGDGTDGGSDGDDGGDGGSDGSGELGLGETFTTPTDLEVTIEDVRLQDSYEYTDFDGSTQVETAPDGEQFAFVDIHVRNVSGETRETPNRLSFDIVAGTEQKQPLGRVDTEKEGIYEGLETVVDGVESSGFNLYLIDADVDRAGIRIFHDGYDIESEEGWEVIWTVE